MPNYQAAPSGHAISRKIADLLENIDPIQYSGSSTGYVSGDYVTVNS